MGQPAPKSTKPIKRDETARRGKTVRITLDPTASLSIQKPHIEDEKWVESQLEDPERWDGMS